MNLINLLEKAMDGSALRHNVLSNNVTNANTPGFKRSEVNFRSALDQARQNSPKLKTTKATHLTNLGNSGAMLVIDEQNTSLRYDGNNVDIDLELAHLAENHLYFNSLANFLSAQLGLLRQAISEGRR